MRDTWTNIRDFVTNFRMNPIMLGTVILFVLLACSAGLLWWGEISYIHPGPAFAAVGSAVVILVVGLVINNLQAQRNVIRPGRLPRIIGLEVLVERWKRFEREERDRAILYEQFWIALSMAQLAYGHLQEIRLIKYFSGFKIKGGAFLLQPGQDSPQVLKFDSLANIEEEKDRYEHCVAPCLGQVPGQPRVPSQWNGNIEGKKWGAIIYNLIGANQADVGRLGTLSEYYLARDDPEQITNALNKMFEALRPWWASPTWPPDCEQWRRNTLYDEYDRLTRKQRQMEQGIAQVGQALQIGPLQNITASCEYIQLDDNMNLRNPLNWVRDVFERRQLAGWISQDELRRDSIVHGDFHPGNILISQDEHNQLRAWVIDFPHTHVGPTIQDIARLEADLKFGLLTDDTLQELGFSGLFSFEECLLPTPRQSGACFADLMPGELPTNQQASPQLQKAWKAVCVLREEALGYMIGNDARPYYLALLHATMPILHYGDRRPWQKLYAFVSAALLCKYLEG